MLSNNRLSVVFALLMLLSFTPIYTQIVSEENKKKGVIELGADGFNSFIIVIDKESNWQLLKSQFGNSYLIDNKSESKTLIKGFKNHISQMIDEGVNPEDIHIVISSGAAQQKSSVPIIEDLRKLGYTVNIVSEEEEGKLAFRSIVPDSQKNKTMVIDVGSANTKIAWFENGQISSLATYGSKYFKYNISDSTVLADIKNIALKLPKNRTKTVYLIGGMPYKFAKQTRKEDERYTKLNQLESYQPSDEKEKCGATILKELRDNANIEEFVFDWSSNFSIGFLLELTY